MEPIHGGGAYKRYVHEPMKNTEIQGPRECHFPDIEATEEHRERWNKRYSFYFAHIAKTMGANVFYQLPADFQWKFRWHGGPGKGKPFIPFYENRCGVKLRNATSAGKLGGHPAHTRLDVLLEMGLLRCSDIENMDVISIVRDPWKRFISWCNFCGKTLESSFKEIEAGEHEFQDWTKAMGMVDFAYDWNMTVYTKENIKGITAWFADHGVTLQFNGNFSAYKGHRKVCKMEDLTEEQKRILSQILVNETKLYNAVRDNGGMMQIRYGNQWIRNN